MILKALYDYYQRDEDSIPFGYKEQAISFVIVIKADGTFLRIEDYRDDSGKGRVCIVPNCDHNNGESPLLFFDNPLYLLDYSNQTDAKKLEKAHNKFLSFIKRCQNIAEDSGDKDLKSVCEFYKRNELENLKKDKLWDDIVKNPLVWLTFRIDGNVELISSKKILLKYNESNDEVDGKCLITGENDSIVRLCVPTPIAGTKSSAKLVSFNNDSFCSYGKEQGANATISKNAEFAFSSAFKKLTSKDSKNKFFIGTRTYLFWSSSNNQVSKDAEECLYNMFGSTTNDDPNRKIELVRQIFNDIYSGKRPSSDEDRFYFLGLAPNSARIAVVYWNECSLRDFAGMILRHFDDMEIVDTRKDDKKKPYQGLHQMMGAVTLGGKSTDVQPNLPDATIKSILQGLPYPMSLYQSCIRRIRAEQDVSPYGSPCRMAILKAYLNRKKDNNKNIEVMLDKQNENTGYLCGRLFATLEKIQENANHIHSIRERYMNAASSTPSTVFATILNLSVHHLEKMSNGQQIFFEKMKQEIIAKLPASGFPAHLDLNDQGRFFIGYYHQRQDFYTSKEAKDAGVEIAEE
ncbi:MAG: type I-C CRISPR-associated protein Cas8c/Csd1 [Prevotella sp.]|nr:type I-C CRISPR-associated protein Cas8c/Csd1 [Prevotella sp.]